MSKKCYWKKTYRCLLCGEEIGGGVWQPARKETKAKALKWRPVTHGNNECNGVIVLIRLEEAINISPGVNTQ